MGAFFTNLQVCNASSKAVCAALPKLTGSRAYVSAECNGWVTVYPEATEDQDDKTLRTIAGGLSKTLKADVLAFRENCELRERRWPRSCIPTCRSWCPRGRIKSFSSSRWARPNPVSIGRCSHEQRAISGGD